MIVCIQNLYPTPSLSFFTGLTAMAEAVAEAVAEGVAAASNLEKRATGIPIGYPDLSIHGY